MCEGLKLGVHLRDIANVGSMCNINLLAVSLRQL